MHATVKATGLAAALAVAALTGCSAATGPPPASRTTPAVTTAPATTPPLTVDVTGATCPVTSLSADGYCPGSTRPSPPGGTYQGACAYTLGSNPAGGSAVATGDVEVTNAGSLGAVMRVAITWPQQGYAPLAMTATVRVPGGQTLDVPFHRPLSDDQLSNLQNWQLGHNGDDGCTYGATITSTYS